MTKNVEPSRPKKKKPNITQTTFLSGFKETILMGGEMDAYNIIVKKINLTSYIKCVKVTKEKHQINIHMVSTYIN